MTAFASHALADLFESTTAIPEHERKSLLTGRLLELWERTGHADLFRLARGRAPLALPRPKTDEDWHDAVSSCLMDCFRVTGDAAVFATLFELNQESFLGAIRLKLQRCGSRVDAHDVLQEVFLNIYRYPNRFRCEQHNSFRNWGHRIVQNTVFAYLKGENRTARVAVLDETAAHPADHRTTPPCRSAAEHETARLVDFAYLVYLNLYLRHYGALSQREQRAIQMVELEGASYREAAAALGIRIDNLKMLMFRARRKIYRGLERTMRDLGATAEPFDHA